MTTLSTSGSPDRIAAPVAASGPISALRSFFRYHGALAPAVRLLRNLPFHGKIAVVALAFGASTMVLAVVFQQQVSRSQEAIDRKLVGLTHLKGLMPLNDAITQRVMATVAGSALGPDDPLVGIQQLLGDSTLRSAPSLQRLEGAWQALVAGQGDAARSRALRAAVVDAARAFEIEVITEGGFNRFGSGDDARVASIVSSKLPLLRDASLRLLDELQADAGAADAAASARLLARRWIASTLLDDLQAQLAALAEAGTAADLIQVGESAVTATRNALAALERAEGQGAPAGPGGALVAPLAEALRSQAAFGGRLVDELTRSMVLRTEQARSAWMATAGTVTLLMLVGVYLLVGFHRVMAGGLRNLSSEVRRMADGDLSARPQARGHDEVAAALVSLGGSLTMLSEMFATVRQGVASVAQASGDIARGNGDLAERTERTTRQLEQVVSSVNLYMEQLDQSARRVDEAAHLVEAMRMDAARSRQNMSRLQARMNDLQGKSREIGAIVTVIDNIAFRTNVLALNASIEAAKAGETGRGFAVVAQEVRRLARRSAESARDIQDIVKRSTEDIVQGATLADRTGEALRDTDLHVARVHESMQQIVQLTRGGEANSRTILQSIHELNRLTDENNQLVDQIATASVALSGSGDELSRRVSTFKLT